jgi:hypothetical protein
MNLLVPANPAEMSDVDNKETTTNIPGPSKTKKTEEFHDLSSAYMKKASISTKQGGYGREIDGAKFEPKKGEVTSPRDEDEPSKKRKVSPMKPSSSKKLKEAKTKFETTLTSDKCTFIVAALNDASLEIIEKKEAKEEEVFSQNKDGIQGVQ